MYDYRECPACSAPLPAQPADLPEARYTATLYLCPRCDALYGTCYLGVSYALVSPYWHQGPEQPATTRYFDLTTLGSNGDVQRRHGWYDPATKRITQTG